MFEKYKLMVAMDIVNPLTKTVKIDGLKKLIKRIDEQEAYDKVGSEYYKINRDIKDGKIPDTDLVVVWLNHLDSLNQTKKNVAFHLDNFLG